MLCWDWLTCIHDGHVGASEGVRCGGVRSLADQHNTPLYQVRQRLSVVDGVDKGRGGCLHALQQCHECVCPA